MKALRVVAVGVGRMGRGIAHAFAYAGHAVTLLDLKERTAADFERLATAARTEIATNMRLLAKLGAIAQSGVDRALALVDVQPARAAAELLPDADVILEGVAETREAKAAALACVSSLARPDAVISSTTSTFLVTELQTLVRHPERFLNTHFLNPAYLIPLVELSAGPVTDRAVIVRMTEVLEAIGKVPVLCSAAPGYIVPRLQSLLMSEAARMVAEGVASPADIDKAIRYGFGPRYATVGILEFIDWGGLDVFYYAGHYLAKALNSPSHAPPPEVDRMMADGRRGLREGRGYYDWSQADSDAWQCGKLEDLVRLLTALGQLPKTAAVAPATIVHSPVPV